MKDNATSTVLGAVLILAIGISFLSTMQLEYKPRWEEEKESAHFREVISQFSDLKAQTEKQAGNRTIAPVASPITVRSDPVSGAVRASGIEGSLAFEPGTVTTQVFSPTFTLIEKNGKALGLLNEQWQTSGGSSDITGVERIDSLRIRFTGPTAEKLEFKENAFAQLDVTDANGNSAGTFRSYIPNKEKKDMWVKVTTATGEVLIDQEYAPDLKYKEHNKFWVDALDPSWPFKQLLDATEAPFRVQLTYGFPNLDTNKWPTVDYAVAYVQESELGDDVYVGGGSSASKFTNFENIRTGGRLVFDAPYQQYPSSEIILESGAVIVRQNEGASMVLEPHFSVEQSGTQTLIEVVSPIYQGIADSMGGRSSASVTTTGVRSEQVFGLTPELRYVVNTTFQDIWTDFFNEKLTGAGLSSPGQFTIIKLAGGVQLNVYGVSPTMGVDDIQLRINYNTVKLSLK